MSVTTARVLTAGDPGRLMWIEQLLPEPRPDEVLIETVAGVISVGSELPDVRGCARSGG